ncbi:hypothetical protein B0H12DRAFT_1244104 [Mycena haematopus]|nr:hypothetical protein B0H12DRAFT_1244104 [Mycena haematopus]
MPIPPIDPETAAATLQSAHRATEWAADVQRERESTREARIQALHDELQALRDQWQLDGWVDHDPLDLEWDVSPECARLRATNALMEYGLLRYSKFLRARLRRYERLKYLHELHTPPFSPPPFPRDLDWGQRRIYMHIFKFFHHLEYPPFSHPEFPEHPSMTIWRAGESYLKRPDDPQMWGGAWGWDDGGREGWWGGTATAEVASQLTEADDEISPIVHSVPLPPA